MQIIVKKLPLSVFVQIEILSLTEPQAQQLSRQRTIPIVPAISHCNHLLQIMFSINKFKLLALDGSKITYFRNSAFDQIVDFPIYKGV